MLKIYPSFGLFKNIIYFLLRTKMDAGIFLAVFQSFWFVHLLNKAGSLAAKALLSVCFFVIEVYVFIPSIALSIAAIINLSLKSD